MHPTMSAPTFGLQMVPKLLNAHTSWRLESPAVEAATTESMLLQEQPHKMDSTAPSGVHSHQDGLSIG